MGFKTVVGIRRGRVEVAIGFPETQVKGWPLHFKF